MRDYCGFPFSQSSDEPKNAYADHVMTTPTFHDGVLFVGSMDGFFYALDAADGSLVWKFESGYKPWNRLPYGGVRATPIIVDGKIIFGG